MSVEIYNKIVTKAKEYNNQYNWLADHPNISDNDIEDAKDFMEDHGLKEEADFEDQIVDWLADIIGPLLKYGPAVIGAIFGIPIPQSLNSDIETDDIILPELEKQIGKFASDKVKDSIAKYANTQRKAFNNLTFKKQLIVSWYTTNKIYKDLFTDGDYAKYKAGVISGKRVTNRILFFKIVISSLQYDFKGIIPSFKLLPDMSTEEFTFNFGLYFTRYSNPQKPSMITLKDKVNRIYKVHEFFQKEIEKQRSLESLNKKANIVTIAGGLAAIIALGS